MAAFADPIVLCLVLLGLSILVYRWKANVAVALAAFAVLFLYGFSTHYVSSRLLTALANQSDYQAGPAPVEPRAIVVLGGDVRHQAREFGGDTVGRLTLERVRYAAALHRETGLPILTTGSSVGGSKLPVSVTMADTLQNDFQVPVRWVERESLNTFENAKYTAAILKAEGIDGVYLVTHAWHMLRSREAFAKAGVAVTARPTGFTPIGPGTVPGDFVPRSHALHDSALAMHEWVGRLWYRLAYD